MAALRDRGGGVLSKANASFLDNFWSHATGWSVMKKLIVWSVCFVLGSSLMAMAPNQEGSEGRKTEEMAKSKSALDPTDADHQNVLRFALLDFIAGGPTSGKRVLFGIWDTRVQDYRLYVEANPGVNRSWKDITFVQGEDHPVANVSWDHAKGFCAWLTQKERREGKIGVSDEYRLPTDHEWSCAVGIGDQEDASAAPSSKDSKIKMAYPWGNQWPPPVGAGNYAPRLNVDGYDYTSPVGPFKANKDGLYDIGGNVWQWCEDWLDDEKKYRVLRGGSFCFNSPEVLLSSARSYDGPSGCGENYGFRCVLAPVLSSR